MCRGGPRTKTDYLLGRARQVMLKRREGCTARLSGVSCRPPLQEAFDQLPRRPGGPVVVSDLLGANDALTIDQYGDGKPDDPEFPSDLHVGVKQNGEGQAKLLHKVGDLLCGV